MGIGVLIIGKSGSGKSTSLRNFKKEDVGIVNVISKPLPFKNVKGIFQVKKLHLCIRLGYQSATGEKDVFQNENE